MIIRKLLLILFATIAVIWIGVFLFALNCPNRYNDILSAVSTVFAAMIASAGIFFGFQFKLALELPFSKEILDKQKELYEKYISKIDEIERHLWINSNHGDRAGFGALLKDLIILGREYSKWLSQKQQEVIKRIEREHIELNAESQLAVALGERVNETSEQKQQRLQVIERASDVMTRLLDGGYERYRNKMRDVFHVSNIVRLQEGIIPGNKLQD